MNETEMIDEHTKVLIKQWRANYIMGIVPSFCAGGLGITAWTVYCYTNYRKELENYLKNVRKDNKDMSVQLLKIKIKDHEFIFNTEKQNIHDDIEKILSIQFFDFLDDDEKIEVYKRISWGSCYIGALRTAPVNQKAKKIICELSLKGEL